MSSSTCDKPTVYIASPYTKGDPAINTHFQCEVFDRLLQDGRVYPIAPLWTHFQHTLFPLLYDKWREYDNGLIPLYDACLRLSSESSRCDYGESRSTGADEEVELFRRLGKPVFFSLERLFEWVDGHVQSQEKGAASNGLDGSIDD